MTGKPLRNPMRLGIVAGIALAIAAAAAGWLLWPESPAARSLSISPAPAEGRVASTENWPAAASELPQPKAEPAKPEAPSRPAKAPENPAAQWIGQSAENLAPPKLPLHRGVTGWETQIDSLLSEKVPDRTKAERLLQQLPFLPEEAFARATREAVDRLPDSDYARLARPLIIHPGTHGAIASVLFADLLERPDEITVPTLTEIAQQPEHPFAESAIDDLDLLVDKAKSGWDERIARMRAAMKYRPKPE